jgi:GT2 family glycosyltransferase
MNTAYTQILILNWNGGADTLACVKSVLQYSNARVAVLDNNSTDNSLSLLNEGLKEDGLITVKVGEAFDKNAKLVLLLSDTNLGFAGGNNLLMRQYMDESQVAYFWLLNNDAVAGPETLDKMLETMYLDSNNAFIGSVILDFTRRDIVQCAGLHYYPYFGVSKMLLKNEHWEQYRKHIPFDRIHFQHGASLLVKKGALARVGLMDETFFLYFEEHDWQQRAAELGYRNGLAADAIVYHKGSVSTSSKKHLFFYYYNRSSIIFARKHNSFFVRVISVLLLSGVTLVRTRLNLKSLSWGFKGLLEGLTKKLS